MLQGLTTMGEKRPGSGPKERMGEMKRIVTRGAVLVLAGALAAVPLAGCAGGQGEEGAGQPAAEQGQQPQTPEGSQAPEGSEASGTDEGQQAPQQAIPESAIISVEDLHSMLESGDDVTVVDVRSRAGYTSMSIPGSRNLPAGQQFELRMREIPTDKPVVLIGASDTDLTPEYNMLLQSGFNADSIRVVEGGVQGWAQAGYPTESNTEYKC